MTPYTVLLAGYLGLLAAALAVEGLARVGRAPLRPVSLVLQQALASRVGRWMVWAAWVWVGFHFLAR
jgi:uncharacterized membrane protein YczE